MLVFTRLVRINANAVLETPRTWLEINVIHQNCAEPHPRGAALRGSLILHWEYRVWKAPKKKNIAASQREGSHARWFGSFGP